jgi:hypothetical protein
MLTDVRRNQPGVPAPLPEAPCHGPRFLHRLALRSRLPRLSAVLVGSVSCLALPSALGALIQAVAAYRDRQAFPPTGRLVDVGGYQLHLQVMGEQHTGPTVILDAGLISFSTNWYWVQTQLAESVRVVAYDRAGLGWSEAGPPPRDAHQNAAELHAALHKAGIRGAYILAGHSYGGLVARICRPVSR